MKEQTLKGLSQENSKQSNSKSPVGRVGLVHLKKSQGAHGGRGMSLSWEEVRGQEGGQITWAFVSKDQLLGAVLSVITHWRALSGP